MLVSPYRAGARRWLRGNLHTHTTESDGEYAPAAVLAAYAALGYDFLAISDHDRLVSLDGLRASTAMTLIGAVEVGGGAHVLCVGVREAPAPSLDRQAVVDSAAGQGGFAILNHPNWGPRFVHWPQEDLEELQGYAGIEVYNAVIDRLEGSSLAADRWDMLLTAGRRVWGFANDDMHRPPDLGRAWNMVDADDRSPEAICAALRAGRFYGSTGVVVTEVADGDGRIVVTTGNAQRIRFVARHGAVRAYADGASGEYAVRGDEGYVRAECYGPGDTMAWTQPIFVTSP